jgi:uncharacterized protein YktA (UPF0223 family)
LPLDLTKKKNVLQSIVKAKVEEKESMGVWGREVAQTMYNHVNKCKNNKI